MAYLKNTLRSQIAILKTKNFTYKQIKEILNVPIKTAYNIYKKYLKYKTFDNLPKSGRKRILSAYGERRLIKIMKKDRFQSAGAVASQFNNGLTKIFCDHWYNFPNTFISNLYLSMENRVKKCITNRGRLINY